MDVSSIHCFRSALLRASEACQQIDASKRHPTVSWLVKAIFRNLSQYAGGITLWVLLTDIQAKWKLSSDGGSSEETNVDKLSYAASTGNLNVSDVVLGKLDCKTMDASMLVGTDCSLRIIIHRQFQDIYSYFSRLKNMNLDVFDKPIPVSITNCVLLKTDGTSSARVGSKRSIWEAAEGTIKSTKYTILPSEKAIFQLDYSHGAIVEQIFCNQLLRDFKFVKFDLNNVGNSRNGLFFKVVKKSVVLAADEEASRTRNIKHYSVVLLQVVLPKGMHSGFREKFLFFILYDDQIPLSKLIQSNSVLFMYRPYCAINMTDALFSTVSTGAQGSMAYTVQQGCKLSPFVSECYEEYGFGSGREDSCFLDFHVEYGSVSTLFLINGIDIEKHEFVVGSDATDGDVGINSDLSTGGKVSLHAVQQHTVDLSLSNWFCAPDSAVPGVIGATMLVKVMAFTMLARESDGDNTNQKDTYMVGRMMTENSATCLPPLILLKLPSELAFLELRGQEHGCHFDVGHAIVIDNVRILNVSQNYIGESGNAVEIADGKTVIDVGNISSFIPEEMFSNMFPLLEHSASNTHHSGARRIRILKCVIRSSHSEVCDNLAYPSDGAITGLHSFESDDYKSNILNISRLCTMCTSRSLCTSLLRKRNNGNSVLDSEFDGDCFICTGSVKTIPSILPPHMLNRMTINSDFSRKWSMTIKNTTDVFGNYSWSIMHFFVLNTPGSDKFMLCYWQDTQFHDDIAMLQKNCGIVLHTKTECGDGVYVPSHMPSVFTNSKAKTVFQAILSVANTSQTQGATSTVINHKLPVFKFTVSKMNIRIHAGSGALPGTEDWVDMMVLCGGQKKNDANGMCSCDVYRIENVGDID